MSSDTKPNLTPPSCCSGPGTRYFDSTFKTLDLFMFVIELVLHSDYAAHVARCALDGKELPRDISPGDLAKKSPGRVTKVLRRHSQLLLEMILSRAVDEFSTYLSEIIREVLSSKPEILRTREQVRLDYVLRFESLAELTRDLVDRKVADLGYRGFTEVLDWLNLKLGISMVSNQSNISAIAEIIETRNLIAHNSSTIGTKYIKKVHGTTFKQGELREIDVDYLFRSVEALISFVRCLDEMASKKFGLVYAPYTRQSSHSKPTSNQIQ